MDDNDGHPAWWPDEVRVVTCARCGLTWADDEARWIVDPACPCGCWVCLVCLGEIAPPVPCCCRHTRHIRHTRVLVEV